MLDIFCKYAPFIVAYIGLLFVGFLYPQITQKEFRIKKIYGMSFDKSTSSKLLKNTLLCVGFNSLIGILIHDYKISSGKAVWVILLESVFIILALKFVFLLVKHSKNVGIIVQQLEQGGS